MRPAAGPPAPRRRTLIGQLTVAALLLTVAYLYCIKFAVAIRETRTGWKGVLNAIHEGCVVRNRSIAAEVLTSCRGDQYFIGAMTPEKAADLKTNVVTFWSFAHFAFYLLLGFLCPDIFWLAFGIGVAFEAWEYRAHKCHDLADIMWNTLGFAAGRAVRLASGC